MTRCHGTLSPAGRGAHNAHGPTAVPPQFRQRIIELVGKARASEELARQFEPSPGPRGYVSPWALLIASRHELLRNRSGSLGKGEEVELGHAGEVSRIGRHPVR